MKFNTVKELIEYVHLIGDDCIKNFDITITPISDETPLPEIGVTTESLHEHEVVIDSFSGSPNITASIDSTLDENVLYVDDYDSVPMSCSTGKVTVLGRTIYTNVCESDLGPTIYLNIKLNETLHSSVPFKLKKTHDSKSDYIMVLNPKLLSKHE